MSEKRFVYIEHKGADYILDNPNWDLDYLEMLGDTLEAEEIVDKLNELYDENEQLRLLLKERQYEKDITKCREQNEQLKEENKRLKRNVKTFKEDRDSNFKSAQYFREQLMKIPESIRSVWIE